MGSGHRFGNDATKRNGDISNRSFLNWSRPFILSCDGWLLGWELPQSVGVNQRVVFLLLDTQSLHFVLQGCTLQAQPLGSATTPEI
jgi:hypothetical protein